MSLRIPVSARAADDIKALALRFSKALQELTGKRIRGRKLYDAFVKPIAYESFNEVTKLTGKTQADFPMQDYLTGLKRELRKHLPVPVAHDKLLAALEQAASPGWVCLSIDARSATYDCVATLTGSMFYQSFREHVFNEGRLRHILFVDQLGYYTRTTDGADSGAIVITLDYAHWPNENDPLFDWDRFDSFIRLIMCNAASDNGVAIEVCRITPDNKMQVFEGYNQHQFPKWGPKMSIAEPEPSKPEYAHIFYNSQA